MSRPTPAIRIPYDSDYTALLGTAVYAFAYYEWVVIYLIQQFEPGFVHRYCRGSPMTSADVKKRLVNILKNPAASYTSVSRDELRACCDRFAELIATRAMHSFTRTPLPMPMADKFFIAKAGWIDRCRT